MSLKRRSLSAAKRITIPMFIKLLATNIVASNFLGFCKRVFIIFRAFEGLVSSTSKSVFVSEKRATSAPEISAEQHKRITRNSPPNANVVSNEFRKKISLASKVMLLVIQIKMANHQHLQHFLLQLELTLLRLELE